MENKWRVSQSPGLIFRSFGIAGLAVWLFSAQPVMAGDASNDDWQYSAQAYLWVAEIDIETAAGDDTDIDFDTIIDNLDMTVMGAVGAQKGKWGFAADVIYLDLEDGSNDTLNRFLQLDDIELKAWIVTPMVTYNVVQSDRWKLNLLTGVRYLYLDADVELETTLPPPLPNTKDKTSEDGDAWNGIIGIRGNFELTDRWSMPFQFDVGTGDTKRTWQAFVAAEYTMDNWILGMGYRYLTWEFDDSDTGGDTFNDLTVQGPMIGGKYVF